MNASTGQAKTVTRKVRLVGLREAMFDRYAGDNQTALDVAQKFYRRGDEVVLPTENLRSFLCATNTTSAPKRLLDSRQYRDVCASFACFVDIEPNDVIPFLRKGKPVLFGAFDADGRDPKSGMYVDRRVARLKDGIPNPKVRPVLPLPWELEFKITLRKNNEVNEDMLKRIISDGGLTLGIGTYRGTYGKFEIDMWE